MTQAIRKISLPAAWTGKLRIERSLNSVIPVRQVQSNTVRITPVSSAFATQSSDQLQYWAQRAWCWLSNSCASNDETPSRAANVSASMPYCTANSSALYLLRTTACDVLV